MEQTLQALGGILLKAIPTSVLLLVLYFYFKAMLFGPLAKVLRERRALDAGAREAADKMIAQANLKAQEFENQVRDARAKIYKEQEETRRQWIEDQAGQIAQARGRADAAARAARESIAAEAAAAREDLAGASSQLADQIAAAVLPGRAA